MPSFPERESSILAVLKKKKPGRIPENEIRESKSPAPNHHDAGAVGNTSSADLLGLSTPPASTGAGGIFDVLGDIYNNKANGTQTYNPKKWVDALQDLFEKLKTI